VNRWILLPLLLFVAIEALGVWFWHTDDVVCPACNGVGRNELGYVCPTCAGKGYLWRCSVPGAAALDTASFTLCFFGLFFWVFIINALYVMANPWVDKVDRMEWGLNPMYYVWLYEFDRRRWAAQVTFFVGLFTPIAGGYIFYILTYNAVNITKASIGFLIGCIFLALLAISWYKGFWKPRTTEVMYGESEALQGKDDEKPADYYFPPRPP
jgi:hypothetical protein